MELVAAEFNQSFAATSFNLFDKSACAGVAPPRIKVALLMIFMSIKRLSEEAKWDLGPFTHNPAFASSSFNARRLRFCSRNTVM
jgi:hypothetical protein